MTFYSNLQATAVRLLTKFGTVLTYTNVAQGTFDPATGTTTSDVIGNYTANTVKDEYNSFEKNDASIEQGDIKLFAEDAIFLVGDTVSIDGVVWRIMDAKLIKPGDTNLMWELQARR